MVVAIFCFMIGFITKARIPRNLAMAGDDAGQIKMPASELSAINQTLTQAAAGQQTGPAPGTGQTATGNPGANPADDVIDAEYQDVA